MKKSVKLGIFILIGVIGMTVGMASAQGGPGRGKAQHPGGMNEGVPMQLFQKLNLTDAQKQKLEKLRRENQRENIRLQSNLQLMQLDLEELMEQDKVSEKKVYAKVRKMGELRTKLMLSRTKMMLGMRRILTKAQLKKLKGFMQRREHFKGKKKKRGKGGPPPHQR